jgi:hypothetical protein
MKDLRKFFPFVIAVVAMITFSCTTDYTNPNNLKGTTWRCSSFPEAYAVLLVYTELKFTSTTAVEQWTKFKFDTAATKTSGTETYSVRKSSIIISRTYTDGIQTHTSIDTGTIKDKTITFVYGNNTTVFTKQ